MRRSFYIPFLMMAAAFLTAFAVSAEPDQAQTTVQACVSVFPDTAADPIGEKISEELPSVPVQDAGLFAESEDSETPFGEGKMIGAAETEEDFFFSDEDEDSSRGFVSKLKRIVVRAYISRHVHEFQKELVQAHSRYYAQVEYWKKVALN